MLRINKFSFSTIIRSNLPAKFGYTFEADRKNTTMQQDSRFGIFNALINMNKNQTQHVLVVVDQFCNYLNSKQQFSADNHKYIDSQLKEAADEFKKHIKALELTFKIKRVEACQIQNQGFFKILGIGYPPQQYIHELQLARKGAQLHCKTRQLTKPKDINIQQQLDKHLNKTSNAEAIIQADKQSRLGIFKRITKKLSKQVNPIFEYFWKDPRQRQKQRWSLKKAFRFHEDDHIHADSINITFDYCFEKDKRIIEEARIVGSTKWLCEVRQKDAASIKNNKKRIIFDFQHWRRGNLIPIKRYDL